MAATHYLSVRIGTQWYGIAVNYVIEVLQMVALAQLPATSPDVLGLMTLRDEVMPVIDLRLRFGITEAPITINHPIIALNANGTPFGVVVDDVDDVEVVDEINQYHGHDSQYVDYVARLADRMLLILEVDQLRPHDMPLT